MNDVIISYSDAAYTDPDREFTFKRNNPKKCHCGLSWPQYAPLGATIAEWCSKCPNKPAEVVYLYRRRCECGFANPSFRLPGQWGSTKWCEQCPRRPVTAIPSKKLRMNSGEKNFMYQSFFSHLQNNI